MIIGIPQSIATLLTIILFYAMDFMLIRRYDKKRQATGSGRAWDFTFFIFAMVAVLVLQPVLLPWLSFTTTEPWGLWIQVLGVIVIVLSLGLHYWSRVHLQQYYAERVEVQPEHKVINTGPYALMRHPVITSFFGIATGLFLINPASDNSLRPCLHNLGLQPGRPPGGGSTLPDPARLCGLCASYAPVSAAPRRSS